MRLNSHGMPLAQGRRIRQNSDTPLNLSDSSVSAFYSGLREEWMLAEGRRVEGPVKEVLGKFTPIGWARPQNLALVREDLVAAGRSLRLLEYTPASIEGTADAARSIYRLVGGLEHPAGEALLARLEAVIDGCSAFGELRRAGRNDPVTRWSLGYYGRPSTATVDVAWSILASQEPGPAAAHKFGEEDVVAIFEDQLSTLPGTWQVTTEPIQAAMMVRQSARQIVIRAGLEIDMGEVRRLLVHEIGGHVVRTLNSERTEGTLASLSLGTDSALTEEGLAIWWEHRMDVQQSSVLRRYAARAIAVDIALQAGASEVMAALTPYVGRDEAAVIALRVKRGMRDPEAQGAFTKDHSYLSGYLAVSASLENAPPRRIRALMATKWGLSMLPVTEELLTMGVLQPGSTPWEVCRGLARD